MKSIILLCAAAIIATGTFAQNVVSINYSKSSVMKKGGSVWIVKPMQDEVTMNNGLIIKPNGIAKTADGKTIILGNGDCIGLNGKVVGLNEKDVSFALIKNDRMWVVTKLEEPLLLSDGSTIMPNGMVKRNDGTSLLLKNNEIVDIANSRSATWKPNNEMALNK